MNSVESAVKYQERKQVAATGHVAIKIRIKGGSTLSP